MTTDSTVSAVRDGARRAFLGLRPATALLTRMPVGANPIDAEETSRAPLWFPVVGAAVGLVAALVLTIFSGVGEMPAACLAVLATALLTGAIHEDGLADTADALGGARTREHVFTILKDSRTGAYGVAAIAITMLLRVSLLAALGGAAAWGLVLVHSWARLGPVALMASLPYVTDPATAKNATLVRPSRRGAWLAAIVPSLLLVASVATGYASIASAIVFVALGALATLVVGSRFAARVGGYTGDFLGAAEQTLECVLLLALALMAD